MTVYYRSPVDHCLPTHSKAAAWRLSGKISRILKEIPTSSIKKSPQLKNLVATDPPLLGLSGRPCCVYSVLRLMYSKLE